MFPARRLLPPFLVSLIVSGLFLSPMVSAQMATDVHIKQILTDRIDTHKQGVGLVAIVAEGDKLRIVSHGVTAVGKASPITPDTLFEIGSITNTFTALLLADMVVKNEVKLEDPVEKYLPDGLKLRDKSDQAIRLIDLATHRSGLPRVPSNLKSASITDPFADYSDKDLLTYVKERFATSTEMQAAPKRNEAHEYSNVGYALLGVALSRAAGKPYAELLQTRIFKPLGLNATMLAVGSADEARFANGHNGDKSPAPHWHFAALAPAGAIVMSARDAGRYAQAAAGGIDTPLKAAFALTQRVHGEGISKINPMGLAWFHGPLKGVTVFNHDGGTYGFSSSMWVDPTRKLATVVLANALVETKDISLHLLDATMPLSDYAPQQTTKSQ
jgi:serine-type D-Ala-D-Ala carboxypeptidase/endopeptidase